MTTDTEQSHTLRHTAEEHTGRRYTHNCRSVTQLESVGARRQVAGQRESCSKKCISSQLTLEEEADRCSTAGSGSAGSIDSVKREGNVTNCCYASTQLDHKSDLH